MAKSKKPRKKHANNVVEMKFIKQFKEWYKNMVIAMSLTEQCHTLFFVDGKIKPYPIKMTETLKRVKFKWKSVIGVLSRLPSGQHVITYKQFYVNKQCSLYDVDTEITSEIRALWGNKEFVDPQYRLTAFSLVTPDEQDEEKEIVEYALRLFHHFKIPDLMHTEYEEQYKDLNNMATYCKSTYWMNLVKFEEIITEEI